MCVRRRMTPNNYTIARAIYAQLFCIPIPRVRGSNPLGRTNPLKSHQFFVHRPTAHSLLVLRPTPLSASCAFRPLLPPIPLSKLPPSPAIAATPSERSDAGLGLSAGLGVFGLLWSLQFTHGIARQCQAVAVVHEAI